ncbi:DUF6515 family protein [Cognatitamlana onchidii]|uniref:DUF6515 family protein n=1 Tax=Cognatitamlana onchidii TaxID=2562860 RepID=UPI0010A5EA4A|nr:DUF6515 family protein [Algibacter onchidii]
MTSHKFNIKHTLALLLLFIALILPSNMFSQRMRGGGGHRGGGHSMSRPTHTPSRSHQTTRQSRPTTTQRPQNRSINGGSTRNKSRDFSNKSNIPNKTTRPATSNRASTGQSKVSNRKTSDVKNRSTNRAGNKTGNKVGNKAGNNNKIGNNNRRVNNNININVNNRNTYVRASGRAYVRPPYRYGGFGYYCHRPYFYHPYVPFYWGPVYHPWGFFVATLATTAIIVSITNDDTNEKEEYNYENGNYYLKTEDGFVAVQAPIGAEVPDIPKEAEKVEVNNTTNYYYGGAFYEENEDGYIVVPATAGTIVPGLPEGGEEVKIGDVTYVQFGQTYYQPIQVDGKNMYEIVEVKKEG